LEVRYLECFSWVYLHLLEILW